jgi:hypothetical protein
LRIIHENEKEIERENKRKDGSSFSPGVLREFENCEEKTPERWIIYKPLLLWPY